MIEQFRGEYRWLSNFAPALITLDYVTYPSIEHAYMSAKCDTVQWKIFCSDVNNTPGAVKKASKSITLVKDWDAKKVGVMTLCIKQKFRQEPYKSNLIATGSKHIQGGNYWNDKFWGFCLKTEEGLNTLGKLIMDERKILLLERFR